MNREIDIIKEILRVLENTINELTSLLKEIKVSEDNPAFKIDIKNKGKIC